MITTPWRKAVADVAARPARAGLAIVAMAAGTFAFGTVLSSRAVLDRELRGTFEATRPSSATIFLDGMSDGLVDSVRAMPGVRDAEARGMVAARVRQQGALALFVVRDFGDIRMDRFTRVSGDWPPPADGVLLERSSLPLLGGRAPRTVTMVGAGGVERTLLVTGVVHAPGLAPGWMDHVVVGFVPMQSIARPGNESPAIRIRADGDRPAVRAVAQRVADALARAGHVVGRIDVPEPGRHPHAAQMDTFLFVLGAFGLLALMLAAVLVANLVEALLLEQVREVGVMLALGGAPGQVAWIYLAQVGALAAVALALGIPAAHAAAGAYVDFSAGMLNATVADRGIPLWVDALAALIGLGLPLLVAAGPVRRAVRMSIHEALAGDVAAKPIRISTSLPPALSMPLRDALRRRGRFVRTVATIALGGATFLAARNVSASWAHAVARDAATRKDDLEAVLTAPAAAGAISNALEGVPGIAAFEPWAGTGAELVSDGTRVSLLGPPEGTRMARPRLLAGRWLAPGDSAVVVVNNAVVRADPSVKVGAPLPLKVRGTNFTPTVVGIAAEIMPSATAYVPVGAFDFGGARTVRIALSDRAAAPRAAALVERALVSSGLAVADVARLDDRRRAFLDHLVIIDTALLLAAALVLLVGAIGLGATLAMSVLERTREIGVLSAIGAGPRAIALGVLAEGAAYALTGCVLALVLAVPATAALDAATGSMFIGAPVPFTFSPVAAAAWLVLSLVLAALAGAVPAWRAASGGVREALQHE